jgi:hypothetical protein
MLLFFTIPKSYAYDEVPMYIAEINCLTFVPNYEPFRVQIRVTNPGPYVQSGFLEIEFQGRTTSAIVVANGKGTANVYLTLTATSLGPSEIGVSLFDFYSGNPIDHKSKEIVVQEGVIENRFNTLLLYMLVGIGALSVGLITAIILLNRKVERIKKQAVTGQPASQRA